MFKEKNDDKHFPKLFLKSFMLSFISFIVFSLGFFPLVFYGLIIFNYISLNNLWHIFLFPFIIFIGFVILIVSQLLISGLIIKLFNIRYEPGKHLYNIKDNNSFKWMIVCTLYTPCRKIIEIFIVGRIKNFYYRL